MPNERRGAGSSRMTLATQALAIPSSGAGTRPGLHICRSPPSAPSRSVLVGLILVGLVAEC